MLQLARVEPNERVYDLGSGDGRILIMAAQKFHARAVGIELDPNLVRMSRASVRRLDLERQVTVLDGNILSQDLSAADVVTIYLNPHALEAVGKHLEKYLHHGLRIVVVNDELPGWKPTSSTRILDPDSRMTFTLRLYAVYRPGDWTSFADFGNDH